MRCRWMLPLSAAAAGLLLVTPASAQDVQTIAQGAQVWGQQCVRCHTARSAGEYTGRQWATIVLHMRVRGNLTREEARLVTAFLQATSSPAPARPVGATAEPGKEEPAASGTDAEPGEDRPETAVWLVLLRYLNQLRSP